MSKSKPNPYQYVHADGTTIKISGKQAARATALVQAAPEMLDLLWDIKFTFESVEGSTTINDLEDLYQRVNEVVARAERHGLL